MKDFKGIENKMKYVTPRMKIVTGTGCYAFCMENKDFKVMGNTINECLHSWVKCMEDEGILPIEKK